MENREINLNNYSKAVVRQKMVMLYSLLAFLAAALIFNGVAPRVYETGVWLAIGKAGGGLIESPAQIVRKIREGLYGDYSGIIATNPVDTSLIKMQILSSKAEDAKSALDFVSKEILKENNDLINKKNSILANEKDRLLNRINDLEKYKSDLKNQINFLQNNFVVVLVLMNTDKEIEDSYVRIQEINTSLSDFEPTKIIKEISTSGNPVSPRYTLNIIVGILAGALLGIILALWRERKQLF